MKPANLLLAAICILGVYIATTQQAKADLLPVASGTYEGNYYELYITASPYGGEDFLVGAFTWAEAESAAENDLFHGGINGHLATVTSEAENDFLIELVTEEYTVFAGAWLGGTSADGSVWLVGPEAGNAMSDYGYDNWAAGEGVGDNGYAYMNIGYEYAGIQTGEWADDSGVQGEPDGNDPVIGFFVEYEVPEPELIILLGIGFACVGLLHRRFNA